MSQELGQVLHRVQLYWQPSSLEVMPVSLDPLPDRVETVQEAWEVKVQDATCSYVVVPAMQVLGNRITATACTNSQMDHRLSCADSLTWKFFRSLTARVGPLAVLTHWS